MDRPGEGTVMEYAGHFQREAAAFETAARQAAEGGTARVTCTCA